jgi:Mg-chelatase subunit ChlD
MDAVEPSGQTALGPALLLAAAMCSKAGLGSQVMLCTDGRANIGLGGLDDDATSFERTFAEGFFTRAGHEAAEHHTTVSVIGIKGDECNLNSIGLLADMTGGSVARADAAELTRALSVLPMPRSVTSQYRTSVGPDTSMALVLSCSSVGARAV